jgi:EAL domain-containing protein (putative c-di-GMP-specific phosphodiesterase class I)
MEPAATGSATAPAAQAAVLDRALKGEIRTVFQPIVSLDTRAVMGYEALTRGPEGTALEHPEALFAAARESGAVVELDALCQATAIREALNRGMRAPLVLFINAEEEASRARIPEQHRQAFVDATRVGLRLVVEVTEHGLLNDPAGLLIGARRVRSVGWGMAIDDVGADPRALALMPVIEPDVIKLDLSLLRPHPDPELAEIVNAVAAEAERRGTTLLAEGIETEEQVQRALALGATHGQGNLFGEPGKAVPEADSSRRIPIAGPIHQARTPTPFEVLSATRSTRQVPKSLLLVLARHLEKQAAALAEGAVLISSFQHGGHLGPGVKRRYSQMASRLALVGALGADVGPNPAPGVRGGAIAEADPLQHEWCTALISPHFAGALAALDLGDPGPDSNRRFELAVTYDRNLVVECVRALLSRISPKT